MANLFPDAGLIRYGRFKITTAIIALVAITWVAISYLKIDGFESNPITQGFIIGIPIFLTWTFIIRLLAKSSLRTWLIQFYKYDMQSLRVVCELDDKDELHMYYVKKNTSSIKIKAKQNNRKAILILPFFKGQKSELVIFHYENDFLTPWETIEVKNVTHGQKVPRIAISKPLNIFTKDMFTITLSATDALKNAEHLQYGVKNFLNDAISQRDVLIKRYAEICENSITKIMDTSRFGQSSEAQEIRKSIESSNGQFMEYTKEFVWPMSKQF